MGSMKGVSAVFAGLCLASGMASAQTISFNTLPVLQAPNAPNSNIPNVPNDVDNDGISDLLWFDPANSKFGYWLMAMDANGNFSRKETRAFNVKPGYFVGAVGDFNGDGAVDLVFTSANRDLYLWTNTGGSFSSSRIGTYPENWQLLGAADVDGDGQADLLWWNESESKFGYWIMQNGKKASAKVIPVGAGYHVAAIGYFNASNRVSILWHGPNGELLVWDSQGAEFTPYSVGTLTDASAQSKIDGFNSYTIGIQAGFCFMTVDTSPILNYCLQRSFDANGIQTSAQFTQNGGTFFAQGESIGGTVASIGMEWQPYVYNVVNGVEPHPAMVFIPGSAQTTGPLSSDSFSMAYPVGWYLIGSRSNLTP